MIFYACLILPIKCWHAKNLASLHHYVKLMDERQSIHHSQSKVIGRIALSVKASGV